MTQKILSPVPFPETTHAGHGLGCIASGDRVQTTPLAGFTVKAPASFASSPHVDTWMFPFARMALKCVRLLLPLAGEHQIPFPCGPALTDGVQDIRCDLVLLVFPDRSVITGRSWTGTIGERTIQHGFQILPEVFVLPGEIRMTDGSTKRLSIEMREAPFGADGHVLVDGRRLPDPRRGSSYAAAPHLQETVDLLRLSGMECLEGLDAGDSENPKPDSGPVASGISHISPWNTWDYGARTDILNRLREVSNLSRYILDIDHRGVELELVSATPLKTAHIEINRPAHPGMESLANRLFFQGGWTRAVFRGWKYTVDGPDHLIAAPDRLVHGPSRDVISSGHQAFLLRKKLKDAPLPETVLRLPAHRFPAGLSRTR